MAANRSRRRLQAGKAPPLVCLWVAGGDQKSWSCVPVAQRDPRADGEARLKSRLAHSSNLVGAPLGGCRGGRGRGIKGGGLPAQRAALVVEQGSEAQVEPWEARGAP